MASEFFHLSLLAFMIEYGANNNGKDNSFELFCLNQTPLHLSARSGDLCVVSYFENQKADKNTSFGI